MAHVARLPKAMMPATGTMKPMVGDDDERRELGMGAAANLEPIIEILGLELGRDQRHVHQRRHEREPGGAAACGRVDGDEGERRDHAELGEGDFVVVSIMAMVRAPKPRCASVH